MTGKDPATSEELEKAQKEVVEDIKTLKSLNKALLVVVFVALSVLSAAGITTVRAASDTKEIGQQNRAFLQNFSDYMRCLIVTDRPAVEAYGIEKYYNLCDDLLFRNTGLVPSHTKVTIPSTTTTTLNTP